MLKKCRRSRVYMSFLLALTMVVSLLPAMSMPVYAESAAASNTIETAGENEETETTEETETAAETETTEETETAEGTGTAAETETTEETETAEETETTEEIEAAGEPAETVIADRAWEAEVAEEAEAVATGKCTDTIVFTDCFKDHPDDTKAESVFDDIFYVYGDIYKAVNAADDTEYFLGLGCYSSAYGQASRDFEVTANNINNLVIDKVTLPYYVTTGKLDLEDDPTGGFSSYFSYGTVTVSDNTAADEDYQKGIITLTMTDKLDDCYLGGREGLVLAIPSVTVTYHYEYPITYHCGEGSFKAEYTPSANYVKGVGLTLPSAENLTRSGYKFGGWYTTETCSGNAVTSIGAEDQGSKDFYAKWNAKPVLAIDADDVTASVGSKGKKISASVSVDAVLSYAIKSGSAEDVADVDASTGELTIKKTGTTTVTVTSAETEDYRQSTKDVTVTVTPASYTVSFDVNGHGIAPESQTISYTQVSVGDKAVKPDDPTAPGCIFGGWYREQACITPWDFEEDAVTEDMTLYAGWTTFANAPTVKASSDDTLELTKTVSKKKILNSITKLKTDASVSGNATVVRGSKITVENVTAGPSVRVYSVADDGTVSEITDAKAIKKIFYGKYDAKKKIYTISAKGTAGGTYVAEVTYPTGAVQTFTITTPSFGKKKMTIAPGAEEILALSGGIDAYTWTVNGKAGKNFRIDPDGTITVEKKIKGVMTDIATITPYGREAEVKALTPGKFTLTATFLNKKYKMSITVR